MSAAAVAFGVVFVAELGDKSQLLALTLAARYRALAVLAGLALAAVVLMGTAVVIGGAAAAALPAGTLQLMGAFAFFAFAAWVLYDVRTSAHESETAPASVGSARSQVIRSALALGVAELGDKTMLAAATLAATEGALATWAGATAGMIMASGIAVAVGHGLGQRLPRRGLQYASAGVFAVFGALLLADSLI